jgi:transposase
VLGVAEIRSALEQLAFNQRAALVLRELGGISYREIAATLGVSEAAVETLLFRARRALREQLEGDLTCGEAEAALSRRLDGMLPRSQSASLRAHLRACRECATLERSMRARRAALRGLGFPLPPTLTWPSAPSAVGTGLLAKGAAVVAVGALAAGAGTKALDRARPVEPTAAAATAAASPGGRDPARASVERARRATKPPRRSAHPSIRSTTVRHVSARPRTRVRPGARIDHTQDSAAPAPAPTPAISITAPAAAPLRPTVETLKPVQLQRSRFLKPLVNSPAIETAAVVPTLATIAAVVAPPVAAAAATGAAVPATGQAVNLPSPPVPPLQPVLPQPSRVLKPVVVVVSTVVAPAATATGAPLPVTRPAVTVSSPPVAPLAVSSPPVAPLAVSSPPVPPLAVPSPPVPPLAVPSPPLPPLGR